MDHLFIRNVQARGQLEAFLLSGITSLLALRYYLYLAGYPQVGGGNLHIAHMLWGGLLMLVALVLLLSFLGRRVQRLAALLGGAGFGIFIDEIGKFLTKDNDYFFRPAVGIIYAIFVILYLVTNFLGRRSALTSEVAQLNALNQLEEAVLRDMDPREKERVAALLQEADPHSDLTKRLRDLLDHVEVVPDGPPHAVARLLGRMRRAYDRLWERRGTSVAVQVFFVMEVVFFLAAVTFAILNDIGSFGRLFEGEITYGRTLVVGELASAAVAFGLAIVGVYRLVRSRLEAFEWFRRSVMVNLLLTNFFIFSRVGFGAFGDFVFNIALLIVIRFGIYYERQRSALL